MPTTASYDRRKSGALVALLAFELTRGMFLGDRENWEEVEVEKRWETMMMVDDSRDVRI